MGYIIGGIFLVFLASSAYILKMNKKASLKRKAFRWWVGSFALFLLVSIAAEVEDFALMVFVVPVIALFVFGSLRHTKFCEWCGRMVRTNLPFTDKDHCPRCGSKIS